MRHIVEHNDGLVLAEYHWRRGRRWESLAMTATGEPQSAGQGSHEEFITEHYWGYTARRGGCSEYRGEHPRRRVLAAGAAKIAAGRGTPFRAPIFGGPPAAPISRVFAPRLPNPGLQ